MDEVVVDDVSAVSSSEVIGCSSMMIGEAIVAMMFNLDKNMLKIYTFHLLPQFKQV